MYTLQYVQPCEITTMYWYILIQSPGKGTVDRMTLGELGVGPNGTIRLEMQSADPENQPIKSFKPRLDYTMPDVISVRVASGEKFTTNMQIT